MYSLTRTLVPRVSKALALPVTSTRGVKHNLYMSDGEVRIFPRFTPDNPYPELSVGPYPKTEEERIAAARKYNLLPEDYEPYPEDEAWGDYPKLKPVGEYNRDKYDDFDDEYDRRFYGEPVQMDFDMYKWERVDPLENEKPTPLPSYWVRWLIVISIPSISLAAFHLVYSNRICFNSPWKLRKWVDGSMYTFPHSPHDGTDLGSSHH